MAEPLVISFAADTSRAQSSMQNLAAQVIGNMTQIGVAMQGGSANANSFGGSLSVLANNLQRAASSVGQDLKSIGGATAAAAIADKATLQSVVSAFTAAAVSSNTAATGVKTGISATSTAISTLAAQLPVLAYLGAGIGAAAAAYVTISTAVAAANKQMDEFIALGAESEKTGLGVEFLQRFKDAAKDAKIEVSEIDQALRHASQATTPKFEQDNPVRKQLTDIFESGYTGSFQSKGLSDFLGARDADTRVRAIVTAMQELRDLGLQLAAVDLAEKVFGAATAERIRSGRLDIDAIASRLDEKRDDLISQQQIDNANEFKDRLNDAYEEINKVLETSFTVIEAGKGVNSIWLSIVETTAKAATNAGSFLDKMLQAGRAGDPQTPLYPRQRLPGEGSLGADLGFDAGVSRRGRTLYDGPIGPERPTGFIPDPPAPPRRPLSFYTEQATPKAGRERKGSEATDPIETFVNQLEKSAAAAKAEADNYNKSNAEKQVAIQLAKAQEIASQNGTTLTDAQTASIRKAAENTAAYKDRLADLEQAQRQGAESARFFGQTLETAFEGAILEGRSFSDVLSGLLKTLERSALQAVFTGQGPLAGLLGTAPAASAGSNAVGGLAGALFGGSVDGAPVQGPTQSGATLDAAGGIGLLSSIFGGLFRANGGPADAGQAYTVGERGRELFIPNRNGQIVPIMSGDGGAGSTTDARSFSFDMRGSTLTEAQARAMFTQALGTYDRGLNRSLSSRIKDSQQRYGH